MKDLLLFRLLRAPELDPAALVPLLAELAHVPLDARFPFLGVVVRAAAHPDAALRAAALDALAGAEGRTALVKIAAALDDPDLAARRAAVEALRASSRTDPARFALALYHPDPEVRRAAIAGPFPQGAAAFAFPLLADPATGPELLHRFELKPSPEAPEPPGFAAGALPALLDFTARDLLPRRLAVRLVAEAPWEDTLRWLRSAVQRGPDAVAAVLERAAEGPPEPGEADAFDDLFALLWDPLPEDDDRRREQLFRRMAADMLSWPLDLRLRAVAALLVTARGRDTWPVAAAGIAAVFHPPFLALPWIAPLIRRASVKAVYAAGGNAPRLGEDEVRALLDADICRRDDGSLDLWVIGGLLHFLEQHPYKHLLEWVDERAVVDAFLADVDGSIALLCLRDDSKHGRDHLVERIAETGRLEPMVVRAFVVIATPADRLGFVEKLEPEEASALVIALIRVLRRSGRDLPSKKIAALERLFATVVGRPDLARAALDAWLDMEAPADLAFGVGFLGAVGVAMPAPRFVEIAAALPLPKLRALLAALPMCTVFPYGKEMALAQELASHSDEAVRAWAKERAPVSTESLPMERPATVAPFVRQLSDAEIEAIVTCSEADLSIAVAPCFEGQTAGLAEALARRPPPSAPSVKVCVALLGSHDPMDRADVEIGRFGAATGAFLSALDADAVRTWEREPNLPPLGHALIHRWERHAFALADAFAKGAGIGPELSRALALTQDVLRLSVWDAIASVFSMWRWRDRETLVSVCSADLLSRLIGVLDTDVGEAAASMLATIAHGRVAPALVEARRPEIERMLPDLTPAVRALLRSLVDASGLKGSGVVRAASARMSDRELLAKIAASTDLDELEAWCKSPSTAVVEEAALRLVVLGEAACARILAAIGARPPAPRPLYDSIALWPEGPSLEVARRLAVNEPLPELRFRLSLALAQRGERAFVAHALAAARVETDEPWFTEDDWSRLLSFGETERSLALALADAPHPHAYRRAVGHLLEISPRSAHGEIANAVASFLEAGTERLAPLRYLAARWLWYRGDACGFPVLLAATREHPMLPLAHAAPDLVGAAIDAALATGPRQGNEATAVAILDQEGLDPDASRAALERLLVEASTPAARSFAAGRLRGERRGEKLRALAEAFAWGVRTGRSLTGRLLKVEMTTGASLGYTRLEESRVFVSPLPILRRAPHGRDIVEGLILHELGHHLYHRGEDGARAWKDAEREGIFGLLNTLADEHLERNLRGVDADYGDRLKRLGAYAFQHTDKDVPVADLLTALGGRAFEVLCATRLGIAREPRCVRVASGALLMHMERAGLSFSRFFRALRMGLGDRHGDPRVREALALCKGIRKRTMPELLDLARRLRALFGWETSLVESLGPHETVERGEAEAMIHGEGITQEELEREIERVIDPERRRTGTTGGPRGEKFMLNVSPDESFEPIRTIAKIPRDPFEHARYAAEVAFAARQMRRFLDALGLTMEPERHRLRGRRFDPGRALAVVTRGDPRMLIAREPRIRTDLFLGVLVDCSSSMTTRGNIEKAKLFGAMLAEASRGVPGVDLRLFGFNHHTMFDAGDAAHCAAHGLAADGGNNDAGALFFAAQVARASRRRAKLLVMISDGLPTECSVAALRGLVKKLGSRYGICCAQVAVQPLAEVCFPHYVVLSEADPAPAVRRFGAVVAGLVAKAMAV